jgi:hypothetical protein
MFPALRQLFKTVFLNPENECLSNFFTGDLMSSASEKRFPFSTLLSFGTSQKSAGRSEENTAADPWQTCLFAAKTATLEAKDVPARCREESMSDLSPQLSSLEPHGISKSF